MERQCALCASGARGEAGHSALREHFRSGRQADGAAYILFACTECGSYWTRTGKRGSFSWAARRVERPAD